MLRGSAGPTIPAREPSASVAASADCAYVSAMRLYLDMCSIQRPLDDRAQLRIRLESEAVLTVLALCESGEVELISSDALRFETERNPNPVRRGYAEEVLANARHFVASTAAVEQRARAHVSTGIKPLDALHLACAVEGGADYFCTTDDKFLRRAKTVDTEFTRVVSPLDLIEEVDR
jgi:predicted nucleic acid-binding protein